MKTIIWKKKGILIFILFFFSAVAYVIYYQQGGYSSGSDTNHQVDNAQTVQKSNAEYVVYACGEVRKPGVYRFQNQVRLDEVIKKAGGFTQKADSSAINLAERIQDGQKVSIPVRCDDSNDKGGKSKKINLNSASKEELMKLAGVGESKAEAIITYRREKGSFSRVDDLMKISGIKKGVFDKIKDLISV